MQASSPTTRTFYSPFYSPCRHHHQLQGHQAVPLSEGLQVRVRHRHGNHRKAHPPSLQPAPQLLLPGAGRGGHPATGESLLFTASTDYCLSRAQISAHCGYFVLWCACVRTIAIT